MLPYRLTAPDNRNRLLLALFLAVILHLALMLFEFKPEPVMLPSVSIPYSVSVFLGQRKLIETPALQTGKTQTEKPVIEKRAPIVKEEEKTVVREEPVVKEKRAEPLQKLLLPEKTVRQPVIEKSVPAGQQPESLKKNAMPDPAGIAGVRKPSTPAEPRAGQQEEGVPLPGTIRTAYPRYQLNAPPPYPGLARKRGQEGTVVLQVLVNSRGGVEDLEVETSSGFAILDRAALKAVRKWLFEPGKRGEKKVSMQVRVPVNFNLKK